MVALECGLVVYCYSMLGVKMGTGGSSGYYYLKASAEVRCVCTVVSTHKSSHSNAPALRSGKLIVV